MFNTNLGLGVGILLITLVSVGGSPIVIHAGVAKSQGQQEEAKHFDGVHHQGIANFEGDQGFNKQTENKLISGATLGRYGETAANRKGLVNEGKFDKNQFYQQGGGDVQNHQTKVGHKKGHHKSGFHNSYHKDETGSNNSFFDDGSDEGGAFEQKNHKGVYGNAEQGARHGNNYNAAHFANDGAKRGEYDNADRYNKNYGNAQNYNRNRYLDDREAAARRNAANSYDGGSRYDEEKYVLRPYYPQRPFYAPHSRPYGSSDQYYPPKKHITIYEDPRYIGRAPPYRQYDDDYIELDVRALRDDRRYPDRGSPLDYY